jgi:hypothetical protein
MIKLIIDEYNKWVKDPNNYLNASLYKKGYDPYFPPMQIIGNLLDKSSPSTISKNFIEQKDGIIKYNETPKVITENKIVIIGLEPFKSNPLNPIGTYQKQYKLLYPLPHSNPLVNGGGNIITHRKDINFNDYLEWQLNYFNFYISRGVSSITNTSRHWHKCMNLAKGLINRDTGFIPDPLNENHYKEYQKYGFDWLGEKIFAIDILPMHSGENKSGMIDYGLKLFNEKISILKPKIGIVIGLGGFNKITKSLHGTSQAPLKLGSWEIKHNIIKIGSHTLSLYGVASQGQGTYKDYYKLGLHLSNKL